MGDTGDDTSATAAAGGADASGGGAAEWEELAAEWLDKAVSGAAAMYADAIFKIGDLGQQVRMRRESWGTCGDPRLLGRGIGCC